MIGATDLEGLDDDRGGGENEEGREAVGEVFADGPDPEVSEESERQERRDPGPG